MLRTQLYEKIEKNLLTVTSNMHAKPQYEMVFKRRWSFIVGG